VPHEEPVVGKVDERIRADDDAVTALTAAAR
jgi:hypothetical protein